jgi:hypothetical protein
MRWIDAEEIGRLGLCRGTWNTKDHRVGAWSSTWGLIDSLCMLTVAS